MLLIYCAKLATSMTNYAKVRACRSVAIGMKFDGIGLSTGTVSIAYPKPQP